MGAELAAQVPWWAWPLALFACAFLMGIVAVVGGIGGVLLVPSVISSLGVGPGGLFRCGRLALFVGTLWLVSCWWDGSLTFVRYHIRMYSGVLLTVVAGLAISPGAATRVVSGTTRTAEVPGRTRPIGTRSPSKSRGTGWQRAKVVVSVGP